jgi:hypothetical protein
MGNIAESMEQHKTTHFGFSAVGLENLGASEYTVVDVLVDISGSTDGFASDMEKALQSIVKACKFSPRGNNLLFRLVLFNSSTYEVHGYKLLSQCELSDYDNILNSGGMTALFDVNVNGIEAQGEYGKILAEKDYDVNGILFCITDGYDTASKLTAEYVAKARQRVNMEEQLESLTMVLIGVNPGQYSSYLEEFKDKGEFDQYVETQDADAKTLAKLAAFVSQSISSKSQALVSGAPSQPIQF